MPGYLFGPVNEAFSKHLLGAARERGECRTFDWLPGSDHQISRDTTWVSLLAQCPDNWRPDAICVWMAYSRIPEWVWSAPVPVIGLAADWNLLWHHYRVALPLCDHVLTDAPGVERLRATGLPHVDQAYLFGLGTEWFADPPRAEWVREIDVSFAGNFNPAVHGTRSIWLGRLARHARERRVVIRMGVFGSDYRELLRRSRIVFNYSVRGECNARAFEAVAAGALLFSEAGNAELDTKLVPGQDYVAYTSGNFDELLNYYLDHEAERKRIADAGAAKAKEFTFDQLWSDAWKKIESQWESFASRVPQRRRLTNESALLLSAFEASHQSGSAERVSSGVAQALVDAPNSPSLHHLLGALSAPAAAAPSYRQALACDPMWLSACPHVAESAAMAGDREGAMRSASDGLVRLARVDQLPQDQLSAFVRPDYQRLHVAWERAGWQYAGDPAGEARAKAQWLRWRLHLNLAELTGEIGHFHEAALAAPDDAPTRAALGCALALAGRPIEAINHLRTALLHQPFDRAAARALFQLLGDVNDGLGQRRLANDLRLLSAAAPQLAQIEEWFAQCPPAGDELASVIIAVHNNVELTRACVESIYRHTRGPCEIILIDNGSTDGTQEYLASLRPGQGITHVDCITNANNRGFPAACNQGLLRARGEYVVFLNNDTVVTSGWLDGLVRWSVADWPKVGLVGAVTNAAPDPQYVPAGYAPDLNGLDEFARKRNQQFAGQALDVQRVSGFCLLARRDVLQKVGGFDERFGLGFFDDDDLGIRVRDAGYKLLVALDVFIHHFGSQTFATLRLNTELLLAQNLQLFRDKWGAERAAGYRTPFSAAVTSSAAPPIRLEGQAKVSLCMIVRNEESNLDACLDSVSGIFDETVIVDTGSTDRTREIALARGAKLVDFPWIDDFSAARNISAENASGDYIFWLDADDRLEPADREALIQLLAGLSGENSGYVMKCVCTPQSAGESPTVVDHLRLFRNRPEHRWKYRVHEQILPSLRASGAEIRFSDLRINHVGYQDPALRARKLERDLKILHAERERQPDDPFTLFNLGSVYQELGRVQEAIPLLRESLERSHPADSIVRKLYSLIASCHRRIDQSEAALHACLEGRQLYPEDTELLFLEGALRREANDAARAEACWLALLNNREGKHFASIDAGLRGPKARHNLAVLYLEQNRLPEAEAQWRAALCDDSEFVAAWLGLGELYLKRKDWAQLASVIKQLEGESVGQPTPEAGVLRSRMYLARKEYASAKWVLSELIQGYPKALEPRVILTHVLLQEDREHQAAAAALEDVLRLCPEHREAKHNLEVLRHKYPAKAKI